MNEVSVNAEDSVPRKDAAEELHLEPIEARVLASLVEKEITTPEYYPLTLRALTAACNQKSNRDPVLTLGETDIAEALDSLRCDRRLVWQVDEAGSRVAKYRHALLDKFTFSPRDLAVLCELMLRGPQTQGELRTHCARLASFASLAEVAETLHGLANWDGLALVKQLPPGPGRREARYAHLLCGTEGFPESSECVREVGEARVASSGPSREDRIRALEEDVSGLRAEIKELRAQLAQFQAQFE